MPLERANLPLEGVFGVGADDLIGLGYKWLKIGNKGAVYEKFLGHINTAKSNGLGTEGDAKIEIETTAEFKIIKIEEDDNGDYILMSCRQEGIAGDKGHQAVWLTLDEVRAAYRMMKKFKRKSKIRNFFAKRKGRND